MLPAEKFRKEVQEMSNAIKTIAINVVSGLVLAAITAILSIIWRYVVPKIKERFQLWKRRRKITNETELAEFRDFKNFEEAAELISGAYRENIYIKDENSFILCTREDMRKSLKWKNISSRLKRTARKQKTNTVRFNIYKHINNRFDNK